MPTGDCFLPTSNNVTLHLTDRGNMVIAPMNVLVKIIALVSVMKSKGLVQVVGVLIAIIIVYLIFGQ